MKNRSGESSVKLNISLSAVLTINSTVSLGLMFILESTVVLQMITSTLIKWFNAYVTQLLVI